jgi:hypothetical protein
MFPGSHRQRCQFRPYRGGGRRQPQARGAGKRRPNVGGRGGRRRARVRTAEGDRGGERQRRKFGVVDKRGCRVSTGGSWLPLRADGGGQSRAKAETSTGGGMVTRVLDHFSSCMIMLEPGTYPQPCMYFAHLQVTFRNVATSELDMRAQLQVVRGSSYDTGDEPARNPEAAQAQNRVCQIL